MRRACALRVVSSPDVRAWGWPWARGKRVALSRSPLAAWWRRRELNPGPKTVSTTDLHV